jgi:hypothetical protein
VLDGSLLTRWYSSSASGELVTLEVDFGAALSANRLDVDLDSTMELPPIQLEGRWPDGRWLVLRSNWEPAAEPVPPADSLSDALRILHRHGIGFVLVQNADHAQKILPFDESFETPSFRYERVAADGPARLYQIIPLLPDPKQGRSIERRANTILPIVPTKVRNR